MFYVLIEMIHNGLSGSLLSFLVGFPTLNRDFQERISRLPRFPVLKRVFRKSNDKMILNPISKEKCSLIAIQQRKQAMTDYVKIQ